MSDMASRPMAPSPFADRREAGRELAEHLRHYTGRDDVLVLALPRGGVPVAYEVAYALSAPLEVFVVRKLGVPGHRELAMGALASGGIRVLDEELIRYLGIPQAAVDAVTRDEQAELERGEASYRTGAAPEIKGKLVILTDDGLATGSTMKAAVRAVRQQDPARIVVAVPVGSSEACQSLASVADEVVCARIPARFSAVGQWFLDFSQTTDAEVRDLLIRGREPKNTPG
jgi:predicted phosphoribosyltransferase